MREEEAENISLSRPSSWALATNHLEICQRSL